MNLSVYDVAQVKWFGKLSALALDANLYSDASARLNMVAHAVNVKVNHRAKVNLEGTSAETVLTCDFTAFLTISNRNSEHLVEKELTAPYTTESNQTVVL